MRLLDLFCGAGGAGMGYHRAGFEVVGVDIAPQPHYPFEFHRADALEYLTAHGHEFDAIHASPPCQRWAGITRTAGTQDEYPDLITPLRPLLQATGLPYVIENGVNAPLLGTLILCGTMFGLLLQRHRLFETNPPILFPPYSCNHHRKVVKHGRKPDRDKHFAGVTGHFSDVEFAKQAMGIDWMTQGELAEAIPPAYTEYLGRYLIQCVVERSATGRGSK